MALGSGYGALASLSRTQIHEGRDAYLRQFTDVVGVQQDLLQTSGITQYVVGNTAQGAVTLVHILHMPVTPLKDGDTPKHGCWVALSTTHNQHSPLHLGSHGHS